MNSGVPPSQPPYQSRGSMVCSLDFLAHIAQFQSRQDSEMQGQPAGSSATLGFAGNEPNGPQQPPNPMGAGKGTPGIPPVIQLPMGALTIPATPYQLGPLPVPGGSCDGADRGSAGTSIIKQELLRPPVTEGPKLRRKRLNQNHMYRQLLREKGIYPIRSGASEYQCSRCREVFPKEMFMWRHGVKHLNHKPFKCDICDAPFNRSDSLGRHVRHFHRGGK